MGDSPEENCIPRRTKEQMPKRLFESRSSKECG
jgi:hypothetical protein